MDQLIKFLESLNKSYKEMAIALFIIYLVAFVDCWKISESFKETDLIQQLFLCGGVSVLVLLVGIVFSFWYSCATLSAEVLKKINEDNLNVLINVFGIILPFVITSAFVFLDTIQTRESFELVYFGVCLISIGYSLLSKLASKKPKNREPEEACEKQINETYVNP